MHDLDPERMGGVKIVPFKDEQAIAEATAAWLEAAPTIEERRAFAEKNVAYLRTIIDIRERMTTLNKLYAEL
jgi:hypothetical protein